MGLARNMQVLYGSRTAKTQIGSAGIAICSKFQTMRAIQSESAGRRTSSKTIPATVIDPDLAAGNEKKKKMTNLGVTGKVIQVESPSLPRRKKLEKMFAVQQLPIRNCLALTRNTEQKFADVKHNTMTEWHETKPINQQLPKPKVLHEQELILAVQVPVDKRKQKVHSHARSEKRSQEQQAVKKHRRQYWNLAAKHASLGL